ncbi:hypothetical protein OAG30_00160 [Flavobacteriaceae bacterium]|nr:hypothetical protein [Flavobacteriaceae bacterium]
MESYYDNSHRWVYDTDGNYLYSKRRTLNPNIEREGIFISDTKKEQEEYSEYLYRKENKL